MRLIYGTHTLAQLGGGATYLLTVARQLQRSGHLVTVFAVDLGRAAELADESGVAVTRSIHDLPEEVDAIVSQDHDVALLLRRRYPGRPSVFVLHSDFLDINAPPQVDGAIDALVVLHDRMRRHAAGLAHVPRVERLRQPIDLDLFSPRGPLADKAPRALLLGNYVRGPRGQLVASVCAELGLELRTRGFHTDVVERPDIAMNEADVVIGKDRVILEAMACGRAAYVYDHRGGDGWVTSERYALLEADNFGGTAFGEPIDAARMRADLSTYEPGMGLVNRDLATSHHDVIQHADRLAVLLTSITPSPIAPPRLTDELARLVRLAWQHEARWHHLALEAERVREQLATVQSELASARADEARAQHLAREAGEARRWLNEAEERLRSAEEVEATVTAFRATRRYRMARALARPIDLIRRRSR